MQSGCVRSCSPHDPARDPALQPSQAILRRGRQDVAVRVSRRLRRWLIIGALGIIAVVVGGPFVYIHFIEGDAPAKLSVENKAPPSTVASGSASAAADVPLDGVWKVASNSQAGYRVKEVLFGQHHEAVGRTS